MEHPTIEQLGVKHDYYSSDSNYYSNDAGLKYSSFSDFYDEFGNADVDLNLVFRWDLRWDEDTDSYWMEIFIIKQRKGIYCPVFIEEFTSEDIPDFMKYIQEHAQKLKSIWKPIQF